MAHRARAWGIIPAGWREVTQEWVRPTDEADARAGMIAAERARNYSDAALNALAYADLVGVRSPEGAASLERQAQVYATLHQADMVLRSRMIATVAELDALPEDSVILDDGWYPKVKGSNGKWWRPDCPRGIAAQGTVLPTRLLWTPEDD